MGWGSFNMACDDIEKYLESKHPNVDRSFIDTIQNAFLDGEEWGLTPIRV